ncbi:hypothetical protein LCGC14_3064960 [marine sediment metagenome]|uniref:Uncharacterized protein n=1 Tax=marine sediment metagenome TaxID=412755 RepID=A0A0F8WHT6_9ZZZZ
MITDTCRTCGQDFEVDLIPYRSRYMQRLAGSRSRYRQVLLETDGQRHLHLLPAWEPPPTPPNPETPKEVPLPSNKAHNEALRRASTGIPE